MTTNTSQLGSNAGVARATRGVRVAAVTTSWLFAALMAVSGSLYLLGASPVVSGMHALGYPLYFTKLLGLAKILGAAALVGPRVRVLREWAYAGFVFDLVGAVVSHVATGETAHVPTPVVLLTLLLTSYVLRRRVAAEVV
jgi:hypothetical protein